MINREKYLIALTMNQKVMTLFNLPKIQEFAKIKYKIIELLSIVQATLKKWKTLFIEQKLNTILKLTGILVSIIQMALIVFPERKHLYINFVKVIHK